MPDKNNELKNLIKINDELENYFRNTIIPQLFIDADLKVQKFTPPAMKQFNLSLDDVGKPITDIVDNFRFPSLLDNIQQVMATGVILEKEIQTTDLRWYQMNVLPYISFNDNKTNGVIITFVEITRRIKDLKEQERLISDHETLLDTISHDIKGPITNLVLAVDLFKNVSPNDRNEFRFLLQMVENAITKMQNMIDELIDDRKLQHKYRAEEELLNIEHILEDVRLTITENVIKSGAIIKSEIHVSEVLFSRRKLRSIVYNLISNAIKFASADRTPEIFIKTASEDGFIVISVRDNGIGIDASKHEDIFSKYFRLENGIEGAGVGLYLVKEIVTNSGGKIIVESDPGKGSEFKVYLKAE